MRVRALIHEPHPPLLLPHTKLLVLEFAIIETTVTKKNKVTS
jgi:hypothetical protein